MKQGLFFILSILIGVSCKKEAPPDAEPNVPPVTTANLKGKVTQYDQYGTAYTTGLNTTTVTIDSVGTTCITDQNGFYSFPGISTGTYTLVFKKPGTGLIKISGINFKYTDTLTYNAEIADIPDFLISNAYLKDTSWFATPLPGIYYNANTSPTNNKSKIVAIVGKSPNMSLADPSSYINFEAATLLGNTNYSRFISYNFLSQSYGFPKDSMVYVKIYPVASIAASYYDNELMKPIYTAYGSPYPVLSIKMPQ